MSERSERQSNIELLRIFAALGVVLLHYNNPLIGGGFTSVEDGSINQLLMVVFEASCICAVNIFVLISGYFMRNSSKRDMLKPVELLSMYIVFELLAYLIKELPNGGPFSWKELFSYFMPIYWFIFVYIALYLISPYINLIWQHLKREGKKRFLIILVVLFSIYPIIWESVSYLSGNAIWKQGLSTIGIFGSGAGYTIVNFVLMYLIGCYLKDIEYEGIKYKVGELFTMLIINITTIVCWTWGEFLISGNPVNATTGWNYENPFVISEAVLVFLLFKNMKIKNNKVINVLAAAAFPTYLIHINILEYFRIPDFVQAGTGIFILHALGSILAIYLICFVIYKIYDLATRPLFKLISKKWQKKRFIVVKSDKDNDC